MIKEKIKELKRRSSNDKVFKSLVIEIFTDICDILEGEKVDKVGREGAKEVSIPLPTNTKIEKSAEKEDSKKQKSNNKKSILNRK